MVSEDVSCHGVCVCVCTPGGSCVDVTHKLPPETILNIDMTHELPPGAVASVKTS